MVQLGFVSSGNKTVAIWFALVGFFGGLYLFPGTGMVVVAGFGLGVGLLVVLMMVALPSLRRGSAGPPVTPRRKWGTLGGATLIAAGLAGVVAKVWLGAVGVAAAIAGSAGVAAALAMRAGWIFGAQRRVLAALKADLDRSGAAEAQIAVVATWTSSSVFAALELLMEHRRADAVATILAAERPWAPKLVRQWYLVGALLELGQVDDARRIATRANEHPSQDARARELELLLLARVAVAEHAAPTAIRAMLPAMTKRAWSRQRIEIEADLCVREGDDEAARRLLQELADQHGAPAIKQVAASSRPSAERAAEILAGGNAPFR